MAATKKLPPAPIISMEPISLGREDAAQAIGIGRSTFEAHVQRGTLPKPREIGGRVVWLVEELREAIRALPVSQLLPPPSGK